MKELTVAESMQMDVGRSIARLSSKDMQDLDLEAGDTILIKGKRETVASVWRARPEDEGLDIIRMDGMIRFSSGSSLGEPVEVKKTNVKTAKKITVAPYKEMDPNAGVRTNNGVLPLKNFIIHNIHEKMVGKPFIKGMSIETNLFGTSFRFGVSAVNPKGVVVLDDNTDIEILNDTFDETQTSLPEVSYEDIGGLSEEIDLVREMIELPMKHPEVFERLGIGAPKGVLLSGPPGTGKTLLAKAVASETESAFFSIAGPEIMSKFYGESEKQVREVFEKAEKSAPSIIFIDEIDAIAPKREEVQGEVERRIVAQLLTLMDGLKSRGQVVVIAATNRAEALDPALRRPGRFDREISINVPKTEGRKEILQIHTRGMPLGKDVDLNKIAEITYGYTGADLESLCKEAAMKSLKAYIPSLKTIDEKVPLNVLDKINVNMQNFTDAFSKIEPSAMREVLIMKPKTKWTDIGGLDDVKNKLIESIEWPLTQPELFKQAGIKPPKGILLHGPPGTGKTLLAKAVANESNANFIAVKGPELISKWVGESEKHIREIFKKARQVSPSIIFFDEFDSISQIRGSSVGSDATERIVNQLLTELDGIEELEKVIVIAATNRPDLIDPSLLRPGRMDLKVKIDLPDDKSRKEIFKVHTKNMPIKNLDTDSLVKNTEGMSGADIESICREAGMESIRRAKKESKKEIVVTAKDFDLALQIVKDKIKDNPKVAQDYIN